MPISIPRTEVLLLDTVGGQLVLIQRANDIGDSSATVGASRTPQRLLILPKNHLAAVL